MSAAGEIARATMQEAIAHADYWTRTYGELRTVWHVAGPDRFGRTAVFYVREPEDAEMAGLVACGKAEAVYRTSLPEVSR